MHRPAPRPPPSAVAAILVTAILGAACHPNPRVHPRSAEQLARAYRYLGAGELERAQVAFSHALEFDPDLPEGMNGLGVVARARGDLAGAVRRFEEALAAAPTFAEGHANLGEALLAGGDPARAERALRDAVALNPDLVEPRQNLGRALLRRGLAEPERRAELWGGARDAYLHVLEAEERTPAAHADLALLALLQGSHDEAARGFARALELAPGDAESAHGLCLARAGAGRCAEAREACRRCLSIAPGHTRCEQSLVAVLSCAPPAP